MKNTEGNVSPNITWKMAVNVEVMVVMVSERVPVTWFVKLFQPYDSIIFLLMLGAQFLVHGQVTIIFVVSVCLSVCLCRVFSAVFDLISIKLGHMLYVWV